jgi:hypothetical protein
MSQTSRASALGTLFRFLLATFLARVYVLLQQKVILAQFHTHCDRPRHYCIPEQMHCKSTAKAPYALRTQLERDTLLASSHGCSLRRHTFNVNGVKSPTACASRQQSLPAARPASEQRTALLPKRCHTSRRRQLTTAAAFSQQYATLTSQKNPQCLGCPWRQHVHCNYASALPNHMGQH